MPLDSSATRKPGAYKSRDGGTCRVSYLGEDLAGEVEMRERAQPNRADCAPFSGYCFI